MKPKEQREGVATRVAREFVRENPQMPKMTAAKALVKQHPKLYPSVESARGVVRRITGSSGKRKREQRQDKSLYRPLGHPGDGNRFDLPEPMEDLGDYTPLYIWGKKALLLSDIHAPFHHKGALQIALEEGYDWGVDTIILNGDLLDCYAISRWEKDPRKRDFAKEVESVILILREIREAWPAAAIVWSLGNHEDRYNAYMTQRAPELLSVGAFQFERVMGCNELGIQVVSGERYCRFGKLPVLHGHEFAGGGSGGVNPAKGFWNKAGESMIGGHFHRSSSHSEMTLSGHGSTTFSTGCLCDPHPSYMPINKWNHGFAKVEVVDDEGNYVVDNRKIIGSRTFPV